jgi:hypothetical protein
MCINLFICNMHLHLKNSEIICSGKIEYILQLVVK